VSAAPRYASDLIVDLLVEAGIEYAAFNPGASFRGIHDSLVNHRADAPRVVLCAHEGISVAAAQAYAKATGGPMVALVHDVVGLQHATMAIYNAWCDRAPMLILGGTGPRSKARRRPWIDWIHNAADHADLVRDYVKWDDEPHDAESITESFARALQTAVVPPGGPVYLSYDLDLQEGELPEGFAREALASYPVPAPPAPPAAELDHLGGLLRGAERPLIVTGHAGESDRAFAELVELAELLAAPVIDTGVRHAFPATHELWATGVREVLEGADFVLALDLEDPRGVLGPELLSGVATVAEVSLAHLKLRGWAHDYQPLAPAALKLTASSDAAVSGLLERLREQPPDEERRAARREHLLPLIAERRAAWRDEAARATANGAVPIERLAYELALALKGERYVLASGTNERVEHRFLDLSRPRQYLGWHGGGGLGYGLGAAVGASLAAGSDTIAVDLQADGDLLFTPSALWTMAHLRQPVLVLVHNNRQYANTVGHAAEIAVARGRPAENRHVGASLTDPPVDLAGLARSFGLWAGGPIATADALSPALEEALAVVRRGRPALVDVLTPQI
jgi:thiamine pyrophosphate-dependent acetolactate synthase large subunit-like protein